MNEHIARVRSVYAGRTFCWETRLKNMDIYAGLIGLLAGGDTGRERIWRRLGFGTSSGELGNMEKTAALNSMDKTAENPGVFVLYWYGR